MSRNEVLSMELRKQDILVGTDRKAGFHAVIESRLRISEGTRKVTPDWRRCIGTARYGCYCEQDKGKRTQH